jgi:hypothetical protein
MERYFADLFDADDKFWVFDRDQDGRMRRMSRTALNVMSRPGILIRAPILLPTPRTGTSDPASRDPPNPREERPMTTVTIILMLAVLAATVLYTGDRIRQDQRRRDRETVLRIIRYLDHNNGRRSA